MENDVPPPNPPASPATPPPPPPLPPRPAVNPAPIILERKPAGRGWVIATIVLAIILAFTLAGKLVGTLVDSLGIAHAAQFCSPLMRKVILALSLLPIWLIIVFFSPLDAYQAATSVTSHRDCSPLT